MSTKLIQTADRLPTAALALVLLAGSGIANAQYVEHWRIEGGGQVIAGGEYFEGEVSHGITYNPVTDNLLMAVMHRHTVPNSTNLIVIDPENGEFKGWVPSGNGAGGLPGMKVTTVDRGSGDYSIYVSALTDDAKGAGGIMAFYFGDYRLWRWAGSNFAEETTLDSPTKIYQNYAADVVDPSFLNSSSVVGPPLPATDLFSVGVGYSVHAVYNPDANETTIYLEVGGAPALAQTPIFTLTVDESTGTVVSTDAIYLDFPLDGKSYGFTRDSAGNIYRYLDRTLGQITPGGTFLAVNDDTVLPSGTAQLRYMEWNGRSFLGGIRRDPASGHSMLRVAEITQGIEHATLHSVSGHATKPGWKGLRSGDIALDTKRGRFIGLITSNMLVSFSQEEEPRVEVADFSATVNESTGAVTVEWQTTLEIKNAGFNVYRLEGNDTTAGSRVNAALVPSIAGGGGAYSLEDTVTLAPGAIRSYWLENVDLDGNATAHAPVTVTREAGNSAVGEWALY